MTTKSAPVSAPVGDTVGAGGFMRAMRTIPMFVEIAEAIRDFAPNAFVINYTNPMTLCVRTLYEVFPQVDFLIALRRLAVNVVQPYRAADLPVGNNVAHEPPRPSARAAADISYGQPHDLVTLMRIHGNSPPCWLIFSLYRHDSTDARVLQCAKEIHLSH